MRFDNRVLGNSKPNNSRQDLTISILLVPGAEELHKKSVLSHAFFSVKLRIILYAGFLQI